MKSFSEREAGIYRRSALICFACVIICLIFDIQKYTQNGFSFDWNFVLSILLYVILIVLGIRSYRKGKRRENPPPKR